MDKKTYEMRKQIKATKVKTGIERKKKRKRQCNEKYNNRQVGKPTEK